MLTLSNLKSIFLISWLWWKKPHWAICFEFNLIKLNEPFFYYKLITMFIHAHAVVGQWLINFQFLTTMKTSFFCMRSCTSLPVEGVLDLEKPGTSAGAAESEWPSMWTSVLPVALISPLLTAENQYCNTVKKTSSPNMGKQPNTKVVNLFLSRKTTPYPSSLGHYPMIVLLGNAAPGYLMSTSMNCNSVFYICLVPTPITAYPFLREERQLP